MTRFGAFGIHLCISLLIFAGLAYLILFIWYPGLFFDTDGGWQGMRIIIGVDLVLGPLLTLIVFKQGKPSLRFDLTCIGIFQAACLVAGTYLVYSQRPLAMVYVDGHFTSVSADSFTEAGLEVPDLDGIPGDYPKWVMVDVPRDLTKQSEFRGRMLKQGRRLYLAADHYRPFQPDASEVVEKSYHVSELLARDRETHEVPKWLADHGGTLSDYRFYPYGGRYAYNFIGFRDATSEPVGILKTPGPV